MLRLKKTGLESWAFGLHCPDAGGGKAGVHLLLVGP